MDQLNLKNNYELKLLVAMLPKPYLGSRFVVSCPVSDVNKLRVKGGHTKLCMTVFTESTQSCEHRLLLMITVKCGGMTQ